MEAAPDGAAFFWARALVFFVSLSAEPGKAQNENASCSLTQ
jgi:hypothetical protein